MFALERMNKIKEMLFKKKHVEVFELSELFAVTEVTIRRDLCKLEQEGFLIRTHGGAVLNERLILKLFPSESEENSTEEKRMIGKIASEMIGESDAIYLSPGTICLEIARNIKDKKVTVVTNDLLIGYELKDSISIKVIVTGGDIMQSTSKLLGGFALRTLSGIYIDKAFIGVSGVNFDSGYTMDSHAEVMVIQEVRKISSEIFIVTDYPKFNCTAFAGLGDLTLARNVITGKQVPLEYKKYFSEHAIKLYTANAQYYELGEIDNVGPYTY